MVAKTHRSTPCHSKLKAAAPDGLTLLLTPIAPVAVYQHVYPTLDDDPIVDVQSVTQVATFDLGLAVGPNNGTAVLLLPKGLAGRR